MKTWCKPLKSRAKASNHRNAKQLVSGNAAARATFRQAYFLADTGETAADSGDGRAVRVLDKLHRFAGDRPAAIPRLDVSAYGR